MSRGVTEHSSKGRNLDLNPLNLQAKLRFSACWSKAPTVSCNTKGKECLYFGKQNKSFVKRGGASEVILCSQIPIVKT